MGRKTDYSYYNKYLLLIIFNFIAKRADDFFRFYMEMGKELTSRTNTDVDLLRQIKAGGGYNEQIINDLEVIRSDHPRLIHEDLRKPISTYSKQTFSSMSQDNKKNEVVRKRLIHSTVNHQKDGIEVPRRDINARLKFFLNQDDMKRDNYGCRVVEKYDRSYFETRSNVAMAALRQCVNYNNEGSEQSKQSESSPSTRRSKGFFAIPSPQSSSRFLTRSVSQPIIIEKPPTKPNDRDKSAGKSLTPTHPVVHTFPIIEDETINETPRKEKEASTSIQKSKTEKTLSTNTKTIVSARQYTRPPVPKRSPATPLRLDNILNTSEDVSSKKNKSFSTRDLSAIREKNNKSSVQLSEVKPEQTKKKTQTFRKRLFANKNNKIKNVATKGKQNETATEADIDAEAENEFDTEVLLRSITPPRVENEVSGTKTPRVQKNNNSSRPTTATDNDELESLVTRKNSVFGKKSRPSTAQMMAFRTEQSESDRPITPTPPMVTNSTFTVRSPQHSESVDHERPTFKNMSKAREHLEITKLSTIRSSPIEEYYSPADRGTYKRHNRNNFDRMKKPVPKKELFKEIGKINLELPEKRIARVRSQKDFTVKNAYNLSAPKAQ